jgi:hypothetical protein
MALAAAVEPKAKVELISTDRISSGNTPKRGMDTDMAAYRSVFAWPDKAVARDGGRDHWWLSPGIQCCDVSRGSHGIIAVAIVGGIVRKRAVSE